jgi:hypothetical protein
MMPETCAGSLGFTRYRTHTLGCGEQVVLQRFLAEWPGGSDAAVKASLEVAF